MGRYISAGNIMKICHLVMNMAILIDDMHRNLGQNLETKPLRNKIDCFTPSGARSAA